jgi:hypothetical protein
LQLFRDRLRARDDIGRRGVDALQKFPDFSPPTCWISSPSFSAVAWRAHSYNALPNKAQEVVARYPAGSAVKVYCNPKKPGQGVLEPSEKGGLTVLTILWIVLAVVGAGILVGGLFMQS